MAKVKKCGNCNGTGKVWKRLVWFSDGPQQITCPKCFGKGTKVC